MTADGPRRGDRRASRAPPRASRDAARLEPSRLQWLVAVVLALGVVQILYEEVVLFLATTTGGLPGLLSNRVVAIGVPLTIAALLIVLLVGGALLAEDRDRVRPRTERATRRLGHPAKSPLDPGDGEVGPSDGDDTTEDGDDRTEDGDHSTEDG